MLELTLSLRGDARAALQLREGEASIGSAADNQLVLAGESVLPKHASIAVNGDGAVLRPGVDEARLQVNDRPVQALSFLHDGDRILLGGHVLVVTLREMADEASSSDASSELVDRATQVRRVPPRFLLRGIGGAEAGRLVPVYGRLLIGSGPDCDLVINGEAVAAQHVVLKALSEGLFLRDLGSTAGCLVNGKRVRDGELRPGDRLEIGPASFLVQSIDAAANGTDQSPAQRSSAGRGKLIAAISVVALLAAVVIALLVLR